MTLKLEDGTVYQLNETGNWYPIAMADLYKLYREQMLEVETQKAKVWQTTTKLYQEFVQQVMDYSEGCDEGKFNFLESIGLEDYLPSHTVTVTFEVNVGYATEGRRDDIESDIRYDLERISYSPGDNYVVFDWNED